MKGIDSMGVNPTTFCTISSWSQKLAKYYYQIGGMNYICMPVSFKLKSTCYVNLLSKLSIIFKEWRVIVLFVLQILYTDFFIVTRLIINKINKVQWWILSWRMSSYLSIPYKQWASAPLFLRNGELLGHSPMHNGC